MYSDIEISPLTCYIETVFTFAKPVFSRSQECWPSLYFLQFFLTLNWHKEILVVRFQNHFRILISPSYPAKCVVVVHHFAQEYGCRTKTNTWISFKRLTNRHANKQHYNSSYLDICSSPAHIVVFHFDLSLSVMLFFCSCFSISVTDFS